jgi:hypothetical protein
MLSYKDMSRKFLNLAHRAASHPKCTLLVNNTLDMLSKQIDEEMNGVTSTMDPIISPTNVSLPNELLSTASLKKKEVETKTSKRKKAWFEKKRKCAEKGGNNKENNTKVCDKKKEKSLKVYDKKKGKCSKVSDNTNLSNCIRSKSFNCMFVQRYLILLFLIRSNKLKKC